MTEYIDFVNLIVKKTMPEADLAAWLPQIIGQIAAVQGDLKRYETDLADLKKVREEMLSRVVEYSVKGDVDALQKPFDDLLNRLEVVRTMEGMLSIAHGKLMLKRGEIDGALKAYGHNRDRIAEAEQAAAARLAWESEQKQAAYEKRRVDLAYEGNQDAIENWPDTWQEHEVMVAEQQAAEKAAQLASQEAREAAREAAETSRRARVKEWLQALAPGE